MFLVPVTRNSCCGYCATDKRWRINFNRQGGYFDYPGREQVGEILTRTINSVSGNDYDRDDNERRDQRKGAIECFRSGLCDIVGRRHGLRWRM